MAIDRSGRNTLSATECTSPKEYYIVWSEFKIPSDYCQSEPIVCYDLSCKSVGPKHKPRLTNLNMD